MAKTLERGRSVLVQGGILAAAGIISRIIGLLYRSPLTAIIGDEGNGYYSTAYYIYTIVLLISSYSIPSAMSKILSQKLAVREYRNAQRIFRSALVYVCVIGGAASLLLFFGAGLFVHGASIPVLRVFAPTVFIFGPLGVLRGYFQAHRTMVPTSISQLLEQISNAVVSLTAAYLLVSSASKQAMGDSYRAMYGAIGSAIGTGSGVIIALIFMYLIYRINRDSIKNKVARDYHKDMTSGEIMRTILAVVTPFILSTFIYNFSTTFNSMMFTRILTRLRNLPYNEVATRFGVFAGKSLTISNLPIAIASALATAMMPNISATFAQGRLSETSHTIDRVNRAVMIISFPSAAGLFALADQIVWILFPQKATIAEAAMLLRLLSVTVILYSLSTVSNAILQGIGKVHTPVINAAIALVIQSFFLYLMLAHTDLGNIALGVAAIIYSLCMCFLNGLGIKRAIHADTDYRRTYLLPFLSSVIMGAFSYGIYRLSDLAFRTLITVEYFRNFTGFILSVIAAVIIYTILLAKLHCIDENELSHMPGGMKFAGILKKLRIL